MKMSPTLTAIVAAMATSFTMHAAVAQTTTDKKAVATDKSAVLADKGVNYSDRARMKTWTGEQEKLEQALKVGAGKAEVERNMWRADATKQAMRSGKAVMATKPLANGDMYSDRSNNKGWSDQKEQLEKSLVRGNDLAYYTAALKKMAWLVT